MKNLTILFGILLILFSCKSEKEQSAPPIEQKVRDCFAKQNTDIDLKGTLKKIKEVFIKNGNLSGETPEDYYQLMSEALTPAQETNNDALLAVESIGYIPSNILAENMNCLNASDKKVLAKSKIEKVVNYLDSLHLYVPNGKMSLPKCSIEGFKAGDFKSEFYRELALITAANRIMAASSLPELQQSNNSKDPYQNIKKQNIFIINVNRQGEIMANGKIVSTEDIKPMITKFLLETADQKEVDLPVLGAQKQSQAIVYLKLDKDVQFEVFEPMMKQIETAYSEIRDDYSMKYFKVKYARLNRNKKNLIDTLIPEQVIPAPMVSL